MYIFQLQGNVLGNSGNEEKKAKQLQLLKYMLSKKVPDTNFEKTEQIRQIQIYLESYMKIKVDCIKQLYLF